MERRPAAAGPGSLARLAAAAWLTAGVPGGSNSLDLTAGDRAQAREASAADGPCADAAGDSPRFERRLGGFEKSVADPYGPVGASDRQFSHAHRKIIKLDQNDSIPGRNIVINLGESQAHCATNPCLPGAAPDEGTSTNIVSLGMVAGELRAYGFYQPANLSGAAAAVFIMDGAGCSQYQVRDLFRTSRWQAVADANRLVLVYLAKPTTPACLNSWRHPQTNYPADPGSGDEPYVAAVVADATGRLGLDRARRYLTGGSSGGAMVWDVACDPVNSTLFRGYAVVSNKQQVALGPTGDPNCPGTNTRLFMQLVNGQNDLDQGVCIPDDHCILSFTANEAYWQRRLGCAVTPASSFFGIPVAANRKDDYGACAFGYSPGFEDVWVANGGHIWGGLDGAPFTSNDTNGFWTAQTNWDFFAATRTP